jgi:hypothetical protein
MMKKIKIYAVMAGAVMAAAAMAAVVLPAASASGAPAKAAVPACKAESGAAGTTLVDWIGLPGNGFAGGVVIPLEFSNTGTHTCTLHGHPGVSAIGSNGKQVGEPATWTGTASTVTLKPGATAHAILIVHDAGAFCKPVSTSYLRVYAPGQTVAWPLPLSGGACPGKATMGVDAVHPGTGVPFYTNS